MNVLKDFVSLFIPRLCLGCGGPMVNGEDVVCTRCRLDFPRTNYHLLEENPIEKRLMGRLPLLHAWAFLKFRKQGVVQHMLHQLKYNDHPEVGVLLGKIFGHDLKNAGYHLEFDLIIPVPLHLTRQKKRGYNQSAAFAKGLSVSLGVPWNETVTIRTQRTTTQTRKTKEQRWENVKDVFAVVADTVRDKRILLVDDVITTGATVEACGLPIVNSACRSLSVACIAEAQ